MRKEREEAVRRTGRIGVQLAALGIAFSVFGVSAVFGANALNSAAVLTAADPDEGITQDGELGIAQLSSEENGFFSESSAELPPDESEMESSDANSESSAGESERSDASSPSSNHAESSGQASSSSRDPSQASAASSRPSVSSKPASSAAVSSSPSSSSSNQDDEDLIYIISGAVQCEIVGTGTTPIPQYYEAYRAQAVACRSYMENYKKTYGRYPSMSFKTPHQKTIELVRGVYHEVMYYGESPANAVYHAASGGHTQSSQFVWGGSLAYLTAVESAYDELPSSFSISAENARQKLAASGILVSGDPETWFDLSGATYTDGGFVYTIPVCGVKVKARILREQVFGSNSLKSTKITAITVSGDTITFSTLGYGHGVGMSQRGALGYSAAGWGYRQILTHYYKGVTFKTM